MWVTPTFEGLGQKYVLTLRSLLVELSIHRHTLSSTLPFRAPDICFLNIVLPVIRLIYFALYKVSYCK